MRWPASWKDPAALALLKGTAIDYLLIEPSADLGPIAAEAAKLGVAAGGVPPGVRVIEGEWPGIQHSRDGGASAGPTGVPWVDSNGWKVRLEAALHPGVTIWVSAAPKAREGSYLLAAADAASHGGQWIVTLDDDFAAAIAKKNAAALARWQNLGAATARLAVHSAWYDYPARAVIGVVSDFTGADEFLSQELLNLLARTNQQYRILVKSAPADFKGLRALLYADAAAPDPPLRRAMLGFVQSGGLMIAGPSWGAAEGTAVRDLEHPRYDVRALGKGRIAIARAGADDPYLLANDSVVLVSHRYDLLRFWNAGAVGSYLTASPDGSRSVAHLLFYADRGPTDASLRIAGRYRSAMLWTLDRDEPRRLEAHPDKDGVELHLPLVNQYAAIELEA